MIHNSCVSCNLKVRKLFSQERLVNIGPEEYVQTFIPRDEADLKVQNAFT